MKNQLETTIEKPRSNFSFANSKEIGEILRKKREERNISIETIHRKTFISPRYLHALESGDFSQFPAEVYLTGTIRRYAPYLGLNPDDLIEMYYQSNRVNKEVKLPSTNVQKSISSYKFLLPLSIILLLSAVGLVWYRITNIYVPVQQSLQQQVLTTTPVSNEPLQLQITGKYTSWIKIISDNKTVFEGMLTAGDFRKWEAKDKFELKIGYTPGVEVRLNNKLIDVSKGAVQDVNSIILNRDFASTPDSASTPQ